MLPDTSREAPGAGAVAHGRLARPPRARAGGRPARGSCSSRGAAPACRRAARAAPAGPETTLIRRYRPRSRSSSRRSSMSLIAAALGSTCTSAGSSSVGCSFGSRPRLAAPSGRGGTERFLRCRSCVAGSQKLASAWLSTSSSIGVCGRLALEPAGAVVRPRVGAVVRRWRATFRPSPSNIARSSSGSEPSVVRKLPIITPFRPALTASCCRSAGRGSRCARRRAGTARRGSRGGRSRPTCTTSIGSIISRSPNLVPGRGLSRLIGTLVGSSAASSKAISTRCSRDSPRLRMPPTQVSSPASRDRLDRPDAALVADRRGHLVVVALGRLDVVVDALDARVLERLGALARHVADRGAALEVGVLGHQPGALEDVLEVPLREPLALRDHAEAVRARRPRRPARARGSAPGSSSRASACRPRRSATARRSRSPPRSRPTWR